MIVGECFKLKDCYYIVVNQQGTLEKLPKANLIKRFIIEIRQGLGIYFKNVQEAKKFLYGEVK